MPKNHCKSIGCINRVSGSDFCDPCLSKEGISSSTHNSLADRYPEQYKSLGDLTEIDVFGVLHLFQIPDPSGCLQHASMKLLMAGASTNQTIHKDVREARDVLSRWLQLNQELSHDHS